ncbi:MAG TPA: zf-HC2 domain-containing protein [Sedimentisphaerales bacterium]|nr:zf-HC2 domain-containing protein [Sedimentisphaerales bacterium]
MNSDCEKIKDQIADLVTGILPEAQVQIMEQHLNECAACRDYARALKDEDMLLTEFFAKIDTNITHQQERVLQAINHSDVSKQSETHLIWRTIMKSPITKLAAAAVIIVAVALSINVWDKSIPSAYAFNQTVEANHGVRYIHIKGFDPSQKEPKEYWVECDEFGKLKRARWHMPEWDAPEDGAKVVVWKENKIQLWFKGTTKKKGGLVTSTNVKGADWLYQFAQARNPRLAIERLYEQQAQGKVKIEVDEPADKANPIVVTATYLPESPKSGEREVLFVDKDTKLVTAVKFYLLKDGKYKYRGMQEFQDYNQPIDPEMFDLDKEVPADVQRIDEDQQKIELNKGISPDELEKYENMTPKEMTIVFFQACADEDWDELLKFRSDSEVRQETRDCYGGLEIISIGEPFKTDEYHGWFVPYEVRLKSGIIKKWKLAASNRNIVQRYICDGGF